MKVKIVQIIIILLAVSTAVLGCSKPQPVVNDDVVIDDGSGQEDNNDQNDDRTDDQSLDETTNDPVTEIDTSDWKTYKNNEYGFEMKYPEDWKKSESDFINELNNKRVRGYIFKSDKYILTFGFSRPDESFSINSRTGIGAGDFIEMGTLNVCNEEIQINHLVFENETREVFYKSTNNDDSKYIIQAEFSVFNDDSALYNIIDEKKVKIVNAIIASCRLTE